jgi:maltooligosyltrehalose trehalohydrolase
MQKLGASPRENGCEFVVWAPSAREISVQINGKDQAKPRTEPMEKAADGYFSCSVSGIKPGCGYWYVLDGETKRADPASRLQPDGVHGASEVVAREFPWADREWRGLPLEQLVFYEIHTGTFTPQGTFEAIIPRLRELKQLGATVIELMPIAQFPGARNWGYDGVYPYAAQNSYGGPAALRKLVNACHAQGLGVALDVVYNHLGPEGNYLRDFGPYFTDRYKTPWGEALNFDGAQSDQVRRFFIENALYWVEDCHIDALRLDAVHAIVDTSAVPFLEELATRVEQRALELGRAVHVIAESDLNDSRIVRPRECGGFGLDGQWNDDFHHSVHTLLTHERSGYYADFGSAEHLAKAYAEGYVYSGQYSTYRQRRHGNSSWEVPARRFVVCAQNHDQVGNRAAGERLSALVSFEKLKLAAGVLLLSPFVPLLFMGEEYGELAPFQYFVSHSDANLVEAVRKGRKEEFARFHWHGEVPDPQAEETFRRSRLNWSLREQGTHRMLIGLYAELLRLRRSVPALYNLRKRDTRAWVSSPTAMGVERRYGSDRWMAVFNFGEAAAPVCAEVGPGAWQKVLDSAERRWAGPGTTSPDAFEASESVSIEIARTSFSLFKLVTGEERDSAI